jgi:large subunit ribosomal protein L3
MTNGLIGRKLGMTRVFTESGDAVPVTVIEAGPCHVLQVRTGAVQLGFGAQKESRASKAALGHAKAAGLTAAPAIIREFELAGDAPAAGVEVKVDIFAAGELVKVTGTSKGRGFQGVVRRRTATRGTGSRARSARAPTRRASSRARRCRATMAR